MVILRRAIASEDEPDVAFAELTEWSDDLDSVYDDL